MRQILVVGLAALVIAGSALAQEHPEHPKPEAKQPPQAVQPPQERAKAMAMEATVTGENICLGCTLNKELGAAAQCDKYGHRHVLKVAAVEGGEDLPQMTGWTLHYLETDNAQPYINEHHGEKLTLKGKVYAGQRVFEVYPQ